MIGDHENKTGADSLISNSVYPEGSPIFTFRLKPLEEIKDDCFVVIDTNALLVPYTTSQDSLEQIGKTCRLLVKEKRLIIPGQVAREFAKHRANKIGELFQQLSIKRDSAQGVQKGLYPLLASLDAYKESLRLEDEINKFLKNYRDEVGKVLSHIKNWKWDDPVSQLYGELFTGDIVFDLQFDSEEISKEVARRKLHNIPPGYKDSGAGDLIIWLTILELGKKHKKSVIFVSGDEKTDWFHQSNRQALYPRYELVDEFRRASDGQSFHIIRFSTLLSLYGASEEVVQEIREEEIQPTEMSGTSFATSMTAHEFVTERVRKWLETVYPKRLIPGDETADLFAANENGEFVAIHIKFYPYGFTTRTKLHNLALAIHSRTWDKPIVGNIIVLVAGDEQSADNLIDYSAGVFSVLPSAILYVGFLTKDGEFKYIFQQPVREPKEFKLRKA